jgi:hypothetical protein
VRGHLPEPSVRLRENRLRFGERFSLSLQRTLRIPDDGRRYPLPPGLGRFTIQAVAEHRGRVPETWADCDFFVAMYQREALWIGFDAAPWKPNVVKVGIGRINAVSGDAWGRPLQPDPQNYMVCPPQLWLDGINAGEGFVRQFVAMPLGLGYTVEHQVSGAERHGGIQFSVYEPKAGRFPDEPPPAAATSDSVRRGWSPQMSGGMGLGAGGQVTQKIYPDPHGLEVWDQDHVRTAVVHLVNTEQYRAITGETPAPSAIDARTYTEHGFPWFELYDEKWADLPPSATLSEVSSIDRIADRDEAPLSPDESVDVADDQIRPLRRARSRKP